MGDGTRENPYTREDVLRLIKEYGDTAEGLDLSEKIFEVGIDLRELHLRRIVLKEATLSNAHLEGADLRDAHFEEAHLEDAHLEKAALEDAHLERAELWDAHLEEADLSNAHLERADLEDAHLERAGLWSAHLEGADLRDAHLEGAYLEDAHLQGVFLQDAKFSANTEMESVDWGNYILGEEKEGEEKKERHLFEWAEHTYRQLKQWYTNAGMYDIAAEFFFREREVRRKSFKFLSRNWHHRIAFQLTYWLFGHGERWRRILLWMAGVISTFALIYFAIGSVWEWSAFWNSLYFSAVSFTALGYGSWVSQPAGWVKWLGASEAIVGVSMMALLLVTFVRKWTR